MKKNTIIILTVLFTSAVIFCLAFKNKGGDKLAWVNLTKVYNEFVYKKELENKLTKTQQARKAIIDSVEFELKVLSRQIKAEDGKDKSKIALFQVKRDNYVSKKEEFEEDNAVLEKQYNDQILTQINQYLKDFGKQGEYTYIYGADGSGGLMYASESKDITSEVIVFINERYKGKTE